MLNLTPEIEKTQNALFGGVFMDAPLPRPPNLEAAMPMLPSYRERAVDRARFRET